MLWAMDFLPLRKNVSGVQILLASRLFKDNFSIGPLKHRRSSFQVWRKNTSMVYSWEETPKRMRNIWPTTWETVLPLGFLKSTLTDIGRAQTEEWEPVRNISLWNMDSDPYFLQRFQRSYISSSKLTLHLTHLMWDTHQRHKPHSNLSQTLGHKDETSSFLLLVSVYFWAWKMAQTVSWQLAPCAVLD